ncbi:MAG TPA: major capsid protein [Thermoanaerobaculia bacterium]
MAKLFGQDAIDAYVGTVERGQDGREAWSGGDYGGDILTGMSLNAVHHPEIRRPYYPDRGGNVGYPCVTVNTGRWTVERGVRRPIREQVRIVDLMNRGIIDPVWLTANATTLRKEAWIELDRVVLLSARQRLKAWADLEAKNSYGGFNGMSKMTLEYEAMSDPGEAVVDMDGLSEGRSDSPLFKLRSLPLPITHSDFRVSERKLAISRGSGTPFDTTMAEACSRRVAETLEQTTLGVTGGFSGLAYGGQTTGVTAHDTGTYTSALGASTVYGYTTFPMRLTKTNFTDPSSGTFVPDTTRNEVLAALDQLYAQRYYGPFHLYHSIDWTQYMERVYAVSGGNNNSETLRTMLLKTQGISGVDRLDFLTSTFTFLLVQETSDVARAVNGMEITTVQWPVMGGMDHRFKIMCIKVPQLRGDYSGRTGILHGTIS